jgi:hypothetical protein
MYAGWAAFLLILAMVFAGIQWQGKNARMARPVAAHSTPLVRGSCAVDAQTALVWGRIVRRGSLKGHMDRYVVQTLTRPRRLIEMSATRLRVVPCKDVTGSKKLDYGTRMP